MRSTALTTLFFALFALLSAVAYAVPVSPRGAISKRQIVDAVDNSITSNSDSTSEAAGAIARILASYYRVLITPNTTPPESAYAARPRTETPSAPASKSTSTQPSIPTFRWFTEIAIPSPTPSGV